jgi:all-trans-8'-apo-beta-carotenal 15,15'-oxygenase
MNEQISNENGLAQDPSQRGQQRASQSIPVGAPRPPMAGVSNGEQRSLAFAHAASAKPWTVGYETLDHDLTETSLPVVGTLPPGVRGTFFRNGPATHERGGQRYAHRWDGDGMVQAFRFGSGVSHFGRFVQTAKRLAESKADRFLVNAFGTYIPGTVPVPEDIDTINPANINLCMNGAELLALWEPGSAYRLKPDTLETLGVKTWRVDLKGSAFSAHPKREPDGTLWNFGADPLKGELTIYCIDAHGQLQRSKTLRFAKLAYMHDFAVTEKHLVFVIPPTLVNKQRLDTGMSFAQACEWTPTLGTQVLVVSKADWSQSWYELPPSGVFHIANAWEDEAGVIRLQFMGAPNPISMLAGFSIMQGEYRHRPGAFMTLVEIVPGKSATQEVVRSLEAEFPVIDRMLVGRRNSTVLCVGRSADRDADVPGYDELVSFDVERGASERYAYGLDWMVEEHLLVPEATRPADPATWVIGTALNMRSRQTVVSVFNASAIADGPVAQASLPIALPLGLHGLFVPAGE